MRNAVIYKSILPVKPDCTSLYRGTLNACVMKLVCASFVIDAAPSEGIGLCQFGVNEIAWQQGTGLGQFEHACAAE